MVNYEERVDTTFIGLFLIGFVLLLFGVFGLQCAELFGENIAQRPMKLEVFSAVLGLVGVVLLLLTVFAYRTGEKTAAAVFALFGVSIIVISYSMTTALGEGALGYTSRTDWFTHLAVAILLFIVMIYTILEETPRLVSISVLVIALVFLFLALAAFFDPITAGPGNDEGVANIMAILYGIFGFIGFAFTTYLGLALSQPKKLPIF